MKTIINLWGKKVLLLLRYDMRFTKPIPYEEYVCRVKELNHDTAFLRE